MSIIIAIFSINHTNKNEKICLSVVSNKIESDNINSFLEILKTNNFRCTDIIVQFQTDGTV